MSVYKQQGRPYYMYDFQCGGRRFHGNTQTANKAEARAIEQREREAAKQQIAAEHAAASAFRGEAPLTLSLAIARYWDEAGRHHAGAATTWVDLQRALSHFGGAKRLDEITDSDVAAYVAKRRGERRKGKERAALVSPATVNRTTIDLLRKLMTRARKAWKIPLPDEPDWKVHRIKERGELVRELRPSDEDRLVASLADGYRDIWRFALASGLRLGECFLTWEQVDFEAGVINVIQKGGRPHTIPISRSIAAILSTCTGHHEVYVFTYTARRTIKWRKPASANRIKGQRYPVTYEGLKSEWQRTRDELGLDLRFHDMRHTRATRLLRSSGNLKAAQKLLGHADISTTAKFYAHVDMNDLRSLLDAEGKSAPTKKRLRGKAKTG
ncbi:tyrosine-type recombinase/integrase [Labrys portucalensis]|uniref:Tyrosine-type recombinase/integrase n=1 Tax=Labrys neptuniae TaxID=376174 RepID=A0ABV6Z8S7_9HYPH